jgi:hypothetical protein
MRNKFTIERKFPRQPADCIFKIILSLQLWCPLQRPKDIATLDEMLALSQLYSQGPALLPRPPQVFMLLLSLLTGLRAVIVCNIRLASRLARMAGLCFKLSPHVLEVPSVGQFL